MKYTWFFFIFMVFPLYASEIKEVEDRWKPFLIESVTINPEKDLWSLYSDKKIHIVNSKKFFLLIKGFPSRPGNPTAQCGAGQEMYADIYRIENKQAVQVQRIMVSSCWRSIEQSSAVNDDFSSISWNEKGVTFEWSGSGVERLKAQLNLDAVSPELVFIP
ncbi:MULTISPECIES: hypothetical protein [Tenebrionibacter/Tenebrionicola group]|jgi:hypothetical protein|uniref:Uncharacterized protein n=2 Tax=Tenebrionibacter/Tenebrionicola group TaxID=2969848 RepID=A0A8K0V9J8_9ENTR|nr:MULTISPECIES: hypothetical protein [Tenebrionibacter/Tenebrionicola group]MBK4716680.1 hypothetical protein [Tenebrionibacter intestinalis]MBV5097372.1 hypothetical protein [Tenebrionicola larvae]